MPPWLAHKFPQGDYPDRMEEKIEQLCKDDDRHLPVAKRVAFDRLQECLQPPFKGGECSEDIAIES